ncbi:hypothetical protein BDP81DRAFT_110013 [Colletotrichum phormii]|uniref:Uncharacterized protein n=1 Tax=Colletotrichum phormii TaxID=359342 RepID=A0AAI9ZH66_9PEZI|nr:uncharacterized protein BDP81DRAFT_110013 [Colletotrichum phormii]KAK1624514.1 hypothetical protein BDP81DRAFT_110013 [Colletotrichum phormii]
MGKARAATQKEREREMHTIHVHTHTHTHTTLNIPLAPSSPALASRHRSTGIPALDHGLVDCGVRGDSPACDRSSPRRIRRIPNMLPRSTSLPQLMSWVLADGREPRSQVEAHTPSPRPPRPPPSGFALLLAFALSQDSAVVRPVRRQIRPSQGWPGLTWTRTPPC